MPRRKRVVFLLLFCFGSFLNVGSSNSSKLVAQGYVLQEYPPLYDGQFYQYSQPLPYPSQEYYPQQSFPLESYAPVPSQAPQYHPPVYESVPQVDYPIIEGVILSDTVEPPADEQALGQQATPEKTTEEVTSLREDLDGLRSDYDALLVEKRKLSSELDATQAAMQASEETAAKRLLSLIHI